MQVRGRTILQAPRHSMHSALSCAARAPPKTAHTRLPVQQQAHEQQLELGLEVMLELVKHMDTEARGAWRLVNAAACQAVYESTRTLTARASTSNHAATHLPAPLLSKCHALRQLACRTMHSLRSIHGLPASLQALDISCTEVAVLAPLQRCTGLRQLSAAAVYAAPETVQQLSAVLPQLTGLCHLDLSRNAHLGPGGAQALAAALRQLTGLQLLSLTSINLHAEGARALAPALQRLTGLQRLGLGDNAMGVEGLRALAPALQHLSALEQMDLGGNGMGAGGAQALAPALQRLTALQRLRLHGSETGAAGVQALAPALQRLSGLLHLDLSWNRMGAAGAQALAPALQCLTNLQKLELGWNWMAVDGVQALAPALQGLTGLQQLQLQGNSVRAPSAAALAPALRPLTRLRLLDLSQNRLGEEGARALAAAVKALCGCGLVVQLDAPDDWCLQQALKEQPVPAAAPSPLSMQGLGKMVL